MDTPTGGGLATLLALSDSRLPTGGHVHSGGVEEAITTGLVVDLVTLKDYLSRRVRTQGLVTASIAGAVHRGLDPARADRETDARTPSPAARTASRAQGRGLLRLARRVWAGEDWQAFGGRPHLPVVAGAVGRVSGLTIEQTCATVVYTTMTGSATAAQRLLALDPGDVAALTFELSPLCDAASAEAGRGLADLSDPLLDHFAERHAQRERPLFAS